MPAVDAALALTALVALAAAQLRGSAIARSARSAARAAEDRNAAVLEALRRCGHAAARSPQALRDELAAAIRTLVPAIDGVLIFDAGDDGELACVTASGARVAWFAGTRIARSDRRALPALALAAGHRVTLSEHPGHGFHPADRFAVAVPLSSADGPAGVLYATAPQAAGPGALQTIVTLAEHAGFAYAVARQRECDRRRAEYDALTGLLAPRALRAQLARAVEAARFSTHGRLVLLFVDTDRFKSWNDAYGHAAGDALLRTIAHLLRAAAAGPGDIAARNGGDEFCLLLAATEKAAGIERAERLRRAIESLDWDALRPPGAHVGVSVSASIGVAAFPADAGTVEALLERADEAMYHSKRGGRNAVSYVRADGALERAEPWV